MTFFCCATTMTPMETLYIRRLNEKVSVNTLRKEISRRFSEFGTIIQISAHKSLSRKGQAWVTYDNTDSSQKALTALNGKTLFESPIEVTFAKSNSDNFLLQIENESVENRKRERLQKRTPNKRVKVKTFKSLPTNNVLLLQNISNDVTQENLSFFERFEGFLTTRYIKARNTAFIEFETDDYATDCLQNLDLKQFGEEVVLSYAKK